LLFLLASRPGEVFSKDQIMASLWPDMILGDDTLARAISRLRKALGDETKSPRYVETLPKRGYRLIASVGPCETNMSENASGASQVTRSRWTETSRSWAGVALAMIGIVLCLSVWWMATPPSRPVPPREILVDRANDFYFQYRRADNEAAIQLYERLLADDPDYVPALAGLANALVQKVIRWPDTPGAPEYTKLEDALKSGRTQLPASRVLLAKAQTYAQRSVSLNAADPEARKALGFVLGARKDFDGALAQYRKAVQLDRNAWGALINMGDILEISGRPQEAIGHFEDAYEAMSRTYGQQSARIRPWYAELGVLIGSRHWSQGNEKWVEVWYRRVLEYAPLHPHATSALARLLKQDGREREAEDLCSNLIAKAMVDCKR
jgi:transcriptional activator of cad operon